MKKTLISTDKLLEEGKYYKLLPAYGVFCATGIFFFVVSLVYIKDTKSFLMGVVFVWLPFLFPFGYFLGVKKIIETKKDILKIKSKKFYILQKVCIDKQIVSNKDSTNDTQIIFGENSGVWVGRKKSKEIKVGDTCYVVYLDGDEFPSMVFSQRVCKLEESLKSKLMKEV